MKKFTLISCIIGIFLVALAVVLKALIEFAFVPDGVLDPGLLSRIILMLRFGLFLLGLFFLIKRPALGKEFVYATIALGFGCICAFVFLEVFLRFYNPFGFRVKGEEIFLPAKIQYVFDNPGKTKFDAQVIHTKNKLGFRGEDIPKDFDESLSIIVIGGSTTECLYLSDKKDWPYLVGEELKKKFDKIWINNAGLDGHSTFGHAVLLKDHVVQLKPKVALFLVGINEVGLEEKNWFDQNLVSRNIIRSSEVLSLIHNLIKVLDAKNKNLTHAQIDWITQKQLTLFENDIDAHLNKHRKLFLKTYEKRLNQLHQLCSDNGILPVFITQPLVIGEGVDPATGINLENIQFGKINGQTQWRTLELYNDVLRRFAREHDVFLVDLARRMPKNTEYYYDYMHFTNKGAVKVAQIVSAEMAGFLGQFFSQYKKDR